MCDYRIAGHKKYHMQFFGEAEERGWVSSSRMIEYKSEEHLREYLDVERKKANKSSKKLFMDPPTKNNDAWKVAVEEADEALEFTPEERRSRYTLVYSDKPPPKKHSAPRPRKPRVKKRKLEEIEEEEEEEEEDGVPKKRVCRYSLDIPDPTHVQFLVFSSKKRDSFRKKHPSFTEAKVTEKLKEEWDKLTSDEKAKFIPMGSGVEDVGMGKRYSPGSI